MKFILKGTLVTKYLVSYPIGWPNFRSTKMSLLETIGKDEGLDLIKGLSHLESSEHKKKIALSQKDL